MIHLVTDSTAYLPSDLKAKYSVHTISLKICVGDQTYDEEGGITKEAFYRLLADVATAPTTSQPSAGEFLDLYGRLLGDEDEILSIHISEGLSGTIPNARSAAQELAPDRIHVIDSRMTSVGLLPMVISIGEAIAAGKSLDQLLSMIDRMVQESCAYFMVENLAYLHKGGRINTASRFLGTLLNIKPILYLHEGKIEALDKARTSRRAYARVLDEVVGWVGQRPSRVAVTHIQVEDVAQEMAAQARKRLNCVSLHVMELGPAIGSHVGPGLIGIGACPVGEDGL